MEINISHHTRTWTRAASVMVLALGLWLASSAPADALPNCTNHNTRVVGGACPGNQLCVGTGLCANFSLVLNNSSVTGTSTTVTVRSNAEVQPPSFTLSGCVGQNTVCGTPASQPTFWTSWNSVTPPFNATFGGLRPGRQYTQMLHGDYNTFTDTRGAVATTWPGYQSVTDLNLQVANVTDMNAVISWNTPYPGSSEILYGLSAHTSTTEFNVNNGAEDLTDVRALPDGQAWAGTNQGRLFHRNVAGAWSPVVIPGLLHVQSIAAYSGTHVWAGSLSGVIKYTIDGTNWTSTAVNPLDTIFWISATGPDTAWAVANTGRIYYFNRIANPTAWTLMHTASVSLHSIVSLDNKTIWAVGDAGRLLTSTDAGQTWTETIISPSGGTLRSIETLDGQTIWVGGFGTFLVSINGGNFWQERTTGTNGVILDWQLVSPTQAWFPQNGQLKSYDFNTSTLSIMNLSPQFNGVVQRIGMINGAEFLLLNDSGLVGHYGAAPGNLWFDPTLTTTHSHDFGNSLVPGTPYYFAVLTEGQGVSSGALDTFTTTSPDLVDPTISITNPDDTFYTNTAAFSVGGVADDLANVGPGRLASIVVRRNGVPAALAANPPLAGFPDHVDWTASTAPGLEPGLNTFTADATDASNNTSTQATRDVYLDINNPGIIVLSPSNGDVVGTPTVATNGTAADAGGTNTGVYNVQYQLNNSGTWVDYAITVGPTVVWGQNIGGLVPGPNTLQFRAIDRAGNISTIETRTFDYVEPTFTLTVNPVSRTANAGDSPTYDVTATSVSGFSGNISFTITGHPSGSSYTLPAAFLPAGGTVTATLTITTTVATATGTFPLVITGVSGPRSATTNATLILNAAPDFSISGAPPTQSVIAGNAVNYTITLLANNTFSGNVTLSLDPAEFPPFTSGSVTSPIVPLIPNATATRTFTVTTQANAVITSHPLTITGTSGALTHSTVVFLTGAPDFQFAMNPASQTITAGGSTTYSGMATAYNGFNAPVDFQVDPIDPNVTLGIIPSTLTPSPAGTAFDLQVDTTAAAVPGTYTLTITGRSAAPAITRVRTVTLIINPDTTPPVISNILATPNWNSVGVTWQTDEPANSAVVIYADAARTTVVGVVLDSTTYCTDTCHDLSYSPLNPVTTYYFMVASCDQAATANCSTAVVDGSGQPLQFTTLPEPDLIAPTVIITVPNSGDTVFGLVTISGTASDNNAVSQVHITITGPAAEAVHNQTYTCVAAPVCNFTLTWNTNSPAAPNGFNTISAVANDAAGNPSIPDEISVNVDNDSSAPRVLSGPDVQVTQMGISQCGGPGFPNGNEPCYQAVITWTTDDPSTSEIDYCEGATCAYDTLQRYDDVDPANAEPIYTTHRVTLIHLNPDRSYHYRLTSVNRSGFFTHGVTTGWRP